MLKKRGFDIVILHVFDYLFDDDLKAYSEQYGELTPVLGIEQTRIRSKSDFQKCLDNIQGWRIGIPLVPYGNELFKIIRQARIDYVVFNTGHHPTYIETDEYSVRLSRFAKSFIRNPVETIYKGVWKKVSMQFTNWFPRLFGFRHPNYYIAGTEVYPYRIPIANTAIIHAHSFDYDRFLRNRGRSRPADIPDYEYYVFIADTPWGEHDFHLLGLSSYITKQEYSIAINKFLDYTEAKTGQKIIIAAHPKYSFKENIYNGRPFLYDTEQLIKYSSGVIAHHSGAIKFAIIHAKPICFVSLWKMKNDHHFQKMIKAYADEIKAPIYYLYKDDSLRELTRSGFFYYDSNAYKKFSKKYINPGNSTTGCFLWDIVADELLGDELLKDYV